MLNRMHRAPARIQAFVSLCFAAVILLVYPVGVAAVTPLPADQADWVCVTTSDLTDAFAPLAAHREGQGLTTRIVTINELQNWYWSTPGDGERLRAAVPDMVSAWGTRYLLIGAEQADLPAPFLRWELSSFLWTAPVDLAFACPGNDWDADGDGWVAEPDDAPDFATALAVGRIPAATPAEVAVITAKIRAYEGRSWSQRDRALVASTVLNDLWTPGENGWQTANGYVTEVLDALAAADRPYTADAMLQAWMEEPGGAELTPEALVAAWTTGGYDLVHYFAQGEPDAWSCGAGALVDAEDLEPLALGRPFLLNSLVGKTCNLIEPGLGRAFLFMPNGGAVAVRGFAVYGFVSSVLGVDREFWTALASGEHTRLGDVHRAAVAGTAVELVGLEEQQLASLMLLGDPALLVHLPGGTPAPPVFVADLEGLQAAPNPFNPGTRVSFTLGRDAVARVEIFDVRGRQVALLHDGPLSAGPHALIWRPDARSSDGVFFARVRTGAGEQTVKLLRLE